MSPAVPPTRTSPVVDRSAERREAAIFLRLVMVTLTWDVVLPSVQPHGGNGPAGNCESTSNLRLTTPNLQLPTSNPGKLLRCLAPAIWPVESRCRSRCRAPDACATGLRRVTRPGQGLRAPP